MVIYSPIISSSLQTSGSTILSGSLSVTQGITGSLFGTASFALSASWAPGGGGGGAAFPFTGDAVISGSLQVTGSTAVSGGFTVFTGSGIEFQVRSTGVTIGNISTDNHTVTGSIYQSGSSVAASLRGSGSGVFTVDGTSGRLFQIDDSLSGSLFSVNTAAGLPVIEAFSNNTVRMGQFGQRALFISQSAVGVGVEAPTAKMQISGSNNQSLLLVGSPVSASTLFVSGSGNVGVGTTSPLSILHILGQSGTTGLPSFLLYGESPSNGQRYGLNVSVDQLDVSALGSSARIAFFTGGNASTAASQERMRITSGGLVGIGTTSPETLLHIDKATAGGEGGFIFVENSAASTLGNKAGIRFATNTGASFSGYGSYIEAINTNAGNGAEDLTFGTWNGASRGERMRITSGGNVGIGKTSPSATLDVNGNSIITGSLKVSAGITGSLFGTASFALSASWAPGGGGGGAAFPFTGSAVITGSLTVTGSANISATLNAQSIVETSALRYKDNIEDLELTDVVYKLRPVTFNWKNTSKHDIGFIAEEVQSIIPELVELNENGEVEGIKYSKISTFIVKTLQYQEKQIKELQEQISKLTEEIKTLKNN